MVFSVERLEGESIIIFTLLDGYNFELDTPAAHEEIAKYTAEINKKPIYRITDFSKVTMSFTDLVLGLTSGTKEEPGSLADSRLRNLFVGDDDMVEFAAESLIQTQYGKIPTLVFDSMDEAVAYARALLPD